MESTIILSEDLTEYDGGCRDKSMWLRFYGAYLSGEPLFELAELRRFLAELKSGAFVPSDKHEVKPRIAALKQLLAEAAVSEAEVPAAAEGGAEQLDMFGGEVARG